MIRIRQPTIDEADVLLTLIDALADYEKLPRPDAEARERLIADGFGDNPRFCSYLAWWRERPVGYVITFQTYSSFLALPTLFLEDLFVLPDARGHGVGSALFRFVAAQAVREGCGRMEWMVLDWNQLAIDFYDRLGSSRLSEWYSYRLTGDRLREVAAGE